MRASQQADDTKEKIDYQGIEMNKLDFTKIYAGREMQTLQMIKQQQAQQEGREEESSSEDEYEAE